MIPQTEIGLPALVMSGFGTDPKKHLRIQGGIGGALVATLEGFTWILIFMIVGLITTLFGFRDLIRVADATVCVG
jgi:hypothetical protein